MNAAARYFSLSLVRSLARSLALSSLKASFNFFFKKEAQHNILYSKGGGKKKKINHKFSEANK